MVFCVCLFVLSVLRFYFCFSDGMLCVSVWSVKEEKKTKETARAKWKKKLLFNQRNFNRKSLFFISSFFLSFYCRRRRRRQYRHRHLYCCECLRGSIPDTCLIGDDGAGTWKSRRSIIANNSNWMECACSVNRNEWEGIFFLHSKEKCKYRYVSLTASKAPSVIHKFTGINRWLIDWQLKLDIRLALSIIIRRVVTLYCLV